MLPILPRDQVFTPLLLAIGDRKYRYVGFQKDTERKVSILGTGYESNFLANVCPKSLFSPYFLSKCQVTPPPSACDSHSQSSQWNPLLKLPLQTPLANAFDHKLNKKLSNMRCHFLKASLASWSKQLKSPTIHVVIFLTLRPQETHNRCALFAMCVER